MDAQLHTEPFLHFRPSLAQQTILRTLYKMEVMGISSPSQIFPEDKPLRRLENGVPERVLEIAAQLKPAACQDAIVPLVKRGYVRCQELTEWNQRDPLRITQRRSAFIHEVSFRLETRSEFVSGLRPYVKNDCPPEVADDQRPGYSVVSWSYCMKDGAPQNISPYCRWSPNGFGHSYSIEPAGIALVDVVNASPPPIEIVTLGFIRREHPDRPPEALLRELLTMLRALEFEGATLTRLNDQPTNIVMKFGRGSPISFLAACLGLNSDASNNLIRYAERINLVRVKQGDWSVLLSPLGAACSRRFVAPNGHIIDVASGGPFPTFVVIQGKPSDPAESRSVLPHFSLRMNATERLVQITGDGLKQLETDRAMPPTASKPVEVASSFRLNGAFWQLSFRAPDGIREATSFPSRVGFTHIHSMLYRTGSLQLELPPQHDGVDVTDKATLGAIRGRLAELVAQREHANPTAIPDLDDEAAKLKAYLAACTAPGGEIKTAPNARSKAIARVRNAVNDALNSVELIAPKWVAHMRESIDYTAKPIPAYRPNSPVSWT